MTQPDVGVPGLIIAAPASGSGKTTVTLGLLRALRDSGVKVSSFKVGPDYIDPAFHAAASARPCHTLDPWAMTAGGMAAGLRQASESAELVVGEGVMGLFDGASDGTGSTADLAASLGLPVVLVVDVAAQAGSAAALVHGFTDYRSDIDLAAVIFNRVGGPSHIETLRRACEPLDVTIAGYLPRRAELALPDRHLGLVQAAEIPALEEFLAAAAAAMREHLDVEALSDLARSPVLSKRSPKSVPALGGRIALASDLAFSFRYPHVLEDWRRQGAEIVPFSPLADEVPDAAADAIYLPGGYPELHAGRLAANEKFLGGLRQAAERADIFGECGGYMVLGEGLVDEAGERHAMAGLLPLESSFAERRLHLGYRDVKTVADGPLGPSGSRFRGHEFHYVTILKEQGEAALFTARDASGRDLGSLGRRQGRVSGSFVHLIAAA